MIDGTYKVYVNVLLGRKEGTVVLRTEGDILYADIDAPVVGKQQLEGHADGDTFTARGSKKIKLVGDIEYNLSGEVEGDNLRIHIDSNKGDIDLEGVRA